MRLIRDRPLPVMATGTLIPRLLALQTDNPGLEILHLGTDAPAPAGPYWIVAETHPRAQLWPIQRDELQVLLAGDLSLRGDWIAAGIITQAKTGP